MCYEIPIFMLISFGYNKYIHKSTVSLNIIIQRQ